VSNEWEEDDDDAEGEDELDEVDLDAARATLARADVGQVYLTRAAARRLDGLGWGEADLIARDLAGEVGDVDVAIQEGANASTLRSFAYDPIDDDAPSPTVAGVWRLPTDGGVEALVVVVVEISPFGLGIDDEGYPRDATAYIRLQATNTES